jgi:UDP-glucuronate 4-epimerase
LKVLVTGCAGFIGMHVALRLLARGDAVVGIDNLSDYYDVGLKRARLERLRHERFRFHLLDIADAGAVSELHARERPERVVHLAAQAGVRHSLRNPQAYVRANLDGFVNVLEACRQHGCSHLLFASSSSVYGLNASMPYRASDGADHPVSLYGATKKANEAMAHAYSHLFGIPTTGLRFFTVYGPWGRPDMSPALFTRAILAGETIDVFNHGDMERDFTYVDDIAEGVLRTLERPPRPDPSFDRKAPDPSRSSAPYRLYNIGNHTPVPLMEFISTLERIIGRPASKRLLPMDASDVRATWADVGDLQADTGFSPATPLSTGLERYVAWYRDYHRV